MISHQRLRRSVLPSIQWDQAWRGSRGGRRISTWVPVSKVLAIDDVTGARRDFVIQPHRRRIRLQHVPVDTLRPRRLRVGIDRFDQGAPDPPVVQRGLHEQILEEAGPARRHWCRGGRQCARGRPTAPPAPLPAPPSARARGRTAPRSPRSQQPAAPSRRRGHRRGSPPRAAASPCDPPAGSGGPAPHQSDGCRHASGRARCGAVGKISLHQVPCNPAITHRS